LIPVWAKKYPGGYDKVFPGGGPPQLYKSGNTLRFSLHYSYRQTDGSLDLRKAIYDENWKPLAAWRGKVCGGNLLQWTPKHVCFAIANGTDPTVQAILNEDDLTGPPVEQLINPGTDQVFDIRSDGTTLVWIQVLPGDILDTRPGNLWTSPFATSTAGNVQSLAADATSVYVIQDTRVIRIAKSNAALSVLAEEPAGLWALTVDAGHVYWIEQDGTSTVIRRVRK
jgi:hypothetical protein